MDYKAEESINASFFNILFHCGTISSAEITYSSLQASDYAIPLAVVPAWSLRISVHVQAFRYSIWAGTLISASSALHFQKYNFVYDAWSILHIDISIPQTKTIAFFSNSKITFFSIP